MLIEAGCDGAVMFDFVEEPLDPVAAFVDAFAERGGIDAMIEWANIRGRPLRRNLGPERIAVVGTIGEQDTVARQRSEHVLAAATIVRLAFRQFERDREPERVDESVDLGRKPAAGTSHATAEPPFLPPFAAC